MQEPFWGLLVPLSEPGTGRLPWQCVSESAPEPWLNIAALCVPAEALKASYLASRGPGASSETEWELQARPGAHRTHSSVGTDSFLLWLVHPVGLRLGRGRGWDGGDRAGAQASAAPFNVKGSQVYGILLALGTSRLGIAVVSEMV